MCSYINIIVYFPGLFDVFILLKLAAQHQNQRIYVYHRKEP